MEDGGWRMEDGGRGMEDGGWRMEASSNDIKTYFEGATLPDILVEYMFYDNKKYWLLMFGFNGFNIYIYHTRCSLGCYTYTDLQKAGSMGSAEPNCFQFFPSNISGFPPYYELFMFEL